MGSMAATDMAQQVAEGNVSLRGALEWHLMANHFPPVPMPMVDVCQRIIETQGTWAYDDTISVPEDVRWRGLATAPIQSIIEGFHLEEFLEHFAEEE